MDINTDVDQIWEALGKFGNYQKFQIFFLLLDIFPCAFHLLSVVFIGYKPQYRCAEIDVNDLKLDQSSSSTLWNGSLFITYEKCRMNIYSNNTNLTFIQSQSCTNGFAYSEPKDRTFVSQLDLVCDNAGLSELSQTLVMVGQAFGAAIFTSLADKYGRKSMHIISHICLLFTAFGMSFVKSYAAFAVIRFFIGVFQQGVGLTAAIMLLEGLPMQVRYIPEVFGLLTWTTAVSSVAAFGYFMKDLPWRYMQMALSLFSVYSLVEYWLLEESLRWLIANGNFKEAERITRKAARWNNVKYEDVMKAVSEKMEMKDVIIKADVKPKLSNDKPDIIANNEDSKTLPHEENGEAVAQSVEKRPGAEVVQHYSFFTILKKKRLLFNSLILWYTWTVNSLTYYGIILISSSLSGNRFLNYFLSAVIEYPAALTEFLLVNRIGRRKCCIMFHAIAASALIIATILTTIAGSSTAITTASTAFTLIGKYAITGSFSTIFLYTPELYPTNLRNAGIGFSSAAARGGGMLAPFSNTLAEKVIWAPGAIFGTMCLVVTVLCTFLPETKGHELPQTVEELNAWYKAHSKSGMKKKKVDKGPISENKQEY